MNHEYIFKATYGLLSLLSKTKLNQELINLPHKAVIIGLPKNHEIKQNLMDEDDNYQVVNPQNWQTITIGEAQAQLNLPKHGTKWYEATLSTAPIEMITKIGSIPDEIDPYYYSDPVMFPNAVAAKDRTIITLAPEETKHKTEKIKALIHLVTNLIIYITSASAVFTTFENTIKYKKLTKQIKKAKSPKKKKKLESRLEEEKTRHINIIGEDIILDRKCLKTRTNPSTKGSKVSVRHWVIGHWRELQSGKRIWIKPYLRGPQDGPMKLSSHIIK